MPPKKASSSKRKSSKHSKSSKISSQARQKKRSRRTKSKKLRRGDPSDSSYSDDSTSSLPISSSSCSEDDYYKRGRERKPSDVKGRKRKSKRTNSSSSRSSEDARRVKKRRVSKKSGDSVVRKKTKTTTKKRKLRRDSSVDSLSSRSTRENEVDSAKARKRARSNKDRSPRCSSGSFSDDTCGYDSEVNLVCENSSRRLKSVITVPTRPVEDDKGWIKDGTKEEIVYDHDDYPPCRSNDSNDYCSKRALGNSSLTLKDKRVDGDEALTLIRTTVQRENGEDSLVQDDQSNPQHDGVSAVSPVVNSKSEFSATVATSGSEDLETILRQKALENLRKFRGGFQRNPNLSTDQTSNSGSTVKQSSDANADLTHKNLHKEEVSSEVGASQVVARSTSPTQISHPTRNHEISLEGKSSRTESGTAIKRAVCPSDEVDYSADPHKNPTCIAAVPSKSDLGTSSSIKESSGTHIAAVSSKSKLGTSSSMKESSGTRIAAVTSKSKLRSSSSMKESSGTRSILEQALKTLTSPRSKFPLAESGANSNASKTTQATMGDSSNNQGEPATTSDHPSVLESSFDENDGKEQKDNGKDASQFEQKTMSVMRGGEMVQVSYKVYIPKNARALGRRQLQR